MILTENKYTNKSGTFPNCLMIDASGAGLTDGSEYAALQLNDGWEPFSQAVMDYAGGSANAPTGTPGTPNGVADAAGISQMIEALQVGNGIGPGKFVRWFLADDPSVTGDRVLLLSGQGILHANYPDLLAAVYVGDPDNPTAPYFYKSTDAAGLTRSTSGTYLQLPESRDFVFPNGPRVTSSRWHTVNGYGSSSTKIQKFLTEVAASDNVVVTVVNSATLGFVITANMDCEISLSYTPNPSAALFSGFSLNSTQLTTAISSITAADRLTMGISHNASEGTEVSWRGDIKKDDEVRVHTDGSADGGSPQRGSITLFAKELPRENTDTIMGSTY
jgi:hypothetical protein